MNEIVSKGLCGRFAQLLEYPTSSLQEPTKECILLLGSLNREAVDLLRRFSSFLEQTPPDQREEIYTDAFEFHSPSFPYVGYHLFRENERRALFMAGLKEHYGIHGFSEGPELPDRLSVMLRFLAQDEDAEEREIIDWCVVPALEKMVADLGERSNPYMGVLQALLLALKDTSSTPLEGDKLTMFPSVC